MQFPSFFSFTVTIGDVYTEVLALLKTWQAKHSHRSKAQCFAALVIVASLARSFVQISKRDRTQRVMPRLKTLFAAVFV
jgi:hypothetical protein